jgi:hypothetical protein
VVRAERLGEEDDEAGGDDEQRSHDACEQSHALPPLFECDNYSTLQRSKRLAGHAATNPVLTSPCVDEAVVRP